MAVSVTFAQPRPVRPGDLVAFFDGRMGRVTAATSSHVLHVRGLYWYESFLLNTVGWWLDDWVWWD